ncbi:hypothetical protein ACNFU2_16550 [Chryseobacterium sp. PTM-20240506]|uniref:hypothetical protein n=1 Tax=unclassified Chryseobacterium TaxID=2593645 RepID=UPI00235A2679|nr:MULTISPECIES: hypothetical protein [unclassified Chryseobacterium]MDC8106502.1 hypothetical protein [Chryseobacterium sp. B21-037]MDQ1805005.1 hypothetical protein [Chryseobacterium sp. CKR4-1]
MKYIIFLLAFCCSYAQQVSINLQKQNNNLNVGIISNEKLNLNTDLTSTSINGAMNETEIYPMYENNLYLFVFDGATVVPMQNAYILPHPDEPPSFYKKELENIEKRKNEKIFIHKGKIKKLKYKFLVYRNAKELFQDYPCRMFDCWYAFYSLERGKKYKMQVQLKIKSKIYKSNMVEFVY